MKQNSKVKIEVKDLERVLQSKEFVNSKTSVNLLEYLIECNGNGVIPKEITIAIDVFNRSKDFNPGEDTIVRYNIHKLRSKLKNYYRDNGKNDNTIIEIPKGRYEINFLAAEKLKDKLRTNKISVSYYSIFTIFVTIALLLLSSLYFYYHLKSQENIFSTHHSELWNNFLNNKLETKIVIGDFFVFEEFDKELNKRRRIMDFQINSENDLLNFKISNPSRNIFKTSLGELPHNSIFNLNMLSKVFYSYQKDFTINMSTDLLCDDLIKRNIIYIGEFKNLRELKVLLTNSDITYKTGEYYSGKIIVNNKQNKIKKTLETYHNWRSDEPHVDLALIINIPGIDQGNYLIIAGFGYAAQIEALNILCDTKKYAKLTQQIEKQYKNSSFKYFTLVLEIIGAERVGYNYKVKHFAELPKNYFHNPNN